MSNNIIKVAFSCCVLLLFALPVAGDIYIYKWFDADGGVHYSDRKPQNVESTRIKTKKPFTSNNDSSESAGQQINAAREREEIKELRTQQQKEVAIAEKKVADYCRSLKANIETLTNNARVRIEGEDGELRFLTAEEMVRKRNADQQAFTERCINQ